MRAFPMFLLVLAVGCAAAPARPAADAGAADTHATDAGVEDAGREAPDASSPDTGADAQADAGGASADAGGAAGGADAGGAAGGADAGGPVPLRYLAINVGNASPQYNCWEYKLCRAEDVAHIRWYIEAWQPDIVMLSEVNRREQLTGTAAHGPVLPAGYDGRCGESRHRDTDAPAAWDADDASHEHECVAWKSSRVRLVEGSTLSARGRNDARGRSRCAYDFTGFRATLAVDGLEVTAVAVHPNSQTAECRTDEIGRYWEHLATGERVIIGGDWNSDSAAEIAVPARFRVNYERGAHWDLATHPDEFTAEYALGLYRRKLDDAYSSFGRPCTDCGPFYGTESLPFGSVVGGFDGHPRADSGDGMDHRQILVDLVFDRP